MRNFDISFVDLESFVEVCTYNSFTKAAEKLFVSQPTLSRRIMGIEDELGVNLFKRNGTYIEITDAGKFLYKQALNIIQQKENIYAGMARFSNNVAGTLRVAVDSSFVLDVAVPLIEKMSRQYPDVSISVECYPGINTTRFLQEESVDIGFTYYGMVEGRPNMVHKILGQSQATFVVGKLHPLYEKKSIRWSDLEGETLYTPSSSDRTGKFLDFAARSGVSFAEIILTKTYAEAVLYAATGKGVAVTGSVGPKVISESNDHVHFIPLFGGDYQLGWPVVACSEKNQNPLIAKFFEIVEEK